MKGLRKITAVIMTLVLLISIAGCADDDTVQEGSLAYSYTDYYNEVLKLTAPADGVVLVGASSVRFDSSGIRTEISNDVLVFGGYADDGSAVFTPGNVSLVSDGIEYSQAANIAMSAADMAALTEMPLNEFISLLDSINVRSLISENKVGAPSYFVMYYSQIVPDPNIIFSATAETHYYYSGADGMSLIEKPSELSENQHTITGKRYFTIVPYYEETSSQGVCTENVGDKVYTGAHIMVLVVDM